MTENEKYHTEIVAAMAERTIRRLCVANWILSTAVIVLAAAVIVLKVL